MAAGKTYTPIAKTTLSSAAASVIFSSIPSTFTDLVLIVNAKSQGSNLYPLYKLNTSSSMSRTYLATTLGGISSGRSPDSYIVGENQVYSSGFEFNAICHFINYSNTTTYKTVLVRNNNASRNAEALVSTWRSTAAINSIEYYVSGNFDVGSTFTLYGILAA